MHEQEFMIAASSINAGRGPLQRQGHACGKRCWLAHVSKSQIQDAVHQNGASEGNTVRWSAAILSCLM